MILLAKILAAWVLINLLFGAGWIMLRYRASAARARFSLVYRREA